MSRTLAQPERHASHAPGRRGRLRAGADLCRGLAALACANLRYWPTVAPIVRQELVRWERRAAMIPDPALRAPALDKLRRERFNPRLAATLATLAPRRHRRGVTEAIVALQVAYDYLDVVGEQDALNDLADGGYLAELANAVTQRLDELPGASVVEPIARRAAERCARAQALGHAAVHAGDAELRAWAAGQAAGTGLLWQEWLAGAQASVLSVHALLTAAADEGTTGERARRIDALYLSLGALTMLDSLIDREQDLAIGERGYLRHYANAEQMGRSLQRLATQAAYRARELPHAGHHLVTLAGVIAFYASAPAAGEPPARTVFARVRAGEPRGLIAPTLALMRAWRAADRIVAGVRAI
jgi:tetraprenyl-beta-curcumene synthase